MSAGTTLNLQIIDEFPITPSDVLTIDSDPSNTINKYEKCGLYVGVAGDIRVTYVGGQTITRNFTEGYHPIAINQVHSTGTVATNISAIITN